MDIRAGIITAAVLCVIGAFFAFQSAVRIFLASRKLNFYSLRRIRAMGSWRLIGLGLLFLGIAYWLPSYGQPLAYTYFPPSPTPSLVPSPTMSPTITFTPTLTLIPTLTDTPLVTDTPTATTTPALPPAILALFQSQVTPLPDAVFSPIQFSTEMVNFQAVDPRTVFETPVQHIFGVFSYNDMVPGAQWTALWYRDGELVHQETKPWDGATGGYGYADCAEPKNGWLPGNYQLIIFVGEEWRVIGEFEIRGDAPIETPTSTPDLTITETSTPTP